MPEMSSNGCLQCNLIDEHVVIVAGENRRHQVQIAHQTAEITVKDAQTDRHTRETSTLVDLRLTVESPHSISR